MSRPTSRNGNADTQPKYFCYQQPPQPVLLRCPCMCASALNQAKQTIRFILNFKDRLTHMSKIIATIFFISKHLIGVEKNKFE